MLGNLGQDTRHSLLPNDPTNGSRGKLTEQDNTCDNRVYPVKHQYQTRVYILDQALYTLYIVQNFQRFRGINLLTTTGLLYL